MSTTEQRLTRHVEPIVEFLAWARTKGVTLGTWDRDGQQREVSDRDFVAEYAVEKFATRGGTGE